MNLILRKATHQDIPQLLSLFSEAKDYLKAQGIDQWQTDGPDRLSIVEDISKERTYVYEYNQHIVATAALWLEKDPSYDEIIDGQWLNLSEPYTAIHKVAVSPSMKGKSLGYSLLKELIQISKHLNYRSVRIDTHPDNKQMQHVIQKTGFQYCGIVYVTESSSGKRFGYEYNFGTNKIYK